MKLEIEPLLGAIIWPTGWIEPLLMRSHLMVAPCWLQLYLPLSWSSLVRLAESVVAVAVAAVFLVTLATAEAGELLVVSSS